MILQVFVKINYHLCELTDVSYFFTNREIEFNKEIKL